MKTPTDACCCCTHLHWRCLALLLPHLLIIVLLPYCCLFLTCCFTAACGTATYCSVTTTLPHPHCHTHTAPAACRAVLDLADALQAACIVVPKADLPEPSSVGALVTAHPRSAALVNAAAQFTGVVGVSKLPKAMCKSLRITMIDVVQQARKAASRCLS